MIVKKLKFIFWKLRILFFYFLVGLFTLVYFVILAILLYLLEVSYNLKYRFAVIASYVFITLAKWICGIDYEVHGLSKIPQEPFILVSNHQSFWENFFVQLIIPKHSWVIKKELFNIPLFGQGLKLLDPISIDRSVHSAKQIIDKGLIKLQQGLSIVIFPESTRIACNKNVKFRHSAAKLALHAQVPIVLMVHNAGKIWPKGFWFKKSGLVTVKILDILDFEEIKQHDVRSLNQHIESIVHKEKNLL